MRALDTLYPKDGKRKDEESTKKEKLMLSDDVYCVGFVHFQAKDTEIIQADRIVLKCTLAFLFQFCLFTLLMYKYARD